MAHQLPIPTVVGAGGAEALRAPMPALGQVRHAPETALQAARPDAGVSTASVGTRLPLGLL